MSDTYAIINNDVIINAVAWDGLAAWSPPDGEVMPMPPGAGIGWMLVDGVWSPPAEGTKV